MLPLYDSKGTDCRNCPHALAILIYTFSRDLIEFSFLEENTDPMSPSEQ
jgi:hypothetical protein